MTETEHQALRARFNFACGYCGVSETQSGASLTVDHFQPTSRGGTDEEANWIYACFACNGFKGAFLVAPPGEFLLHPLRDDLPLHLREEDDGTLSALSARGQLHIERLHLNRPQLVSHRREVRVQRERDERIAQLMNELKEMNEELGQLRARLNR